MSIDYLVLLGAIVAIAIVARIVFGAYLKYRGARMVTCPETHEPVGVKVDAGHAALSAMVGQEELRLDSCTRWPERQNCGQECLSQIAEAPEDCLVRSLLVKWYAGKQCLYCEKPFEAVRPFEHRPVLVGSDGVILEWKDIRAAELTSVLATHKPACWNCYIAERFRREHPDLVVERPPEVEESRRRYQ